MSEYIPGQNSLLKMFLKSTIRNLKLSGRDFSSVWVSSRKTFRDLFLTTFDFVYLDKNKQNFTADNVVLVPIENESVIKWKNAITFPSFGTDCFEYFLKLIDGEETLEKPKKNASKYDVVFYLWVNFHLNRNIQTYYWRDFKAPKENGGNEELDDLMI